MEADNRVKMEPHPQRSIAISRLAIWSLTAWLGLVMPTLAATPTEYQLKAVFLFNFIQFVEWPSSGSDPEQGPLCVGVLGPDPFGSDLEAVMQGEQISGRPIVVQRYATVDEIDLCHLLFIGALDAGQVEIALEQLKGRPILTVGETAEFIDAGGMIRFITESSRIRLQVNLRAADEARLRLSSKLLRSSQIVARMGN